jgi:hypothetical protein
MTPITSNNQIFVLAVIVESLCLLPVGEANVVVNRIPVSSGLTIDVREPGHQQLKFDGILPNRLTVGDAPKGLP